jgi:hypothetical protein
VIHRLTLALRCSGPEVDQRLADGFSVGGVEKTQTKGFHELFAPCLEAGTPSLVDIEEPVFIQGLLHQLILFK